MILSHGLQAFRPSAGGSLVAIGNFDGVHRGHQALFEAARRLRDAHGGQVVAVTFEPHPLTVLRGAAPGKLTTLEEKARLLVRFGVDQIVVLPSTTALLQLEPRAFLDQVLLTLKPRAVIEGSEFRFGADRQGDVHTLQEHGRQHGYDVQVVAPVPDPVTSRTVSSSAIRAALQAGDVESAHRMLARPPHVRGTVVRGDGRGAGIGFPTANLANVEHMPPAYGVYAAVAAVRGARYRAAVNVGPQPTFGQMMSRIEAHLLDFEGRLESSQLVLCFLFRLRGQQRFEDITALSNQIREDVRAVRGRIEDRWLRADRANFEKFFLCDVDE